MDNYSIDTDTIAAIATPPGRGGVGIIRVSGNNVATIAQAMTATKLKPRYAHYGPFYEQNDKSSDSSSNP